MNDKKILHDYITAIKNDNLEGTLASIELSLDEKSLEKIIECKNHQRDQLQEEIDKMKNSGIEL